MNVAAETNDQATEAVETSAGEVATEGNNAEQIAFSEFLESFPPSRQVAVSNILSKVGYRQREPVRVISTPAIRLFCEDDHCNGIRLFRTDRNRYSPPENNIYTHVVYKCSNCMKAEKIFFLELKFDVAKSNHGYAYKFGELPPFGPRTPSRLIKLIGPDREDFLKGRNCESQGLGIGAFAYYRRIVENQKTRILEEVIRVAEKVSADEDTISTLGDARNETRFSEAVNLVKDAIPQALLISGENPLTLLYAALSEGLHCQDDTTCLEAARDIRLVLAELAERLGLALKDERELNEAVARLAKRRASK